jgi:hypothetical protein
LKNWLLTPTIVGFFTMGNEHRDLYGFLLRGGRGGLKN